MKRIKNPETIIIKNIFYPKGLREIDIWNYYQKVRHWLLKETRNKELMLAIMTNLNTPVLRRKGSEGLIKLNNSNYDTVITGRTSSIYSIMGQVEDFGIIDIDIDKWKLARIAAIDVYSFIMDNAPIVREAKIRYTGKNGFHIICRFKQRMKIATIRHLLRNFLNDPRITNKYTIEQKRRPNIPNLDLSPNKFRGAYITEGSLSIWGLKCMKVNYNEVLRFDQHRAKI